MLPSHSIYEELREKEQPACWACHNLLPLYHQDKHILIYNDWKDEFCILLGDSKPNVRDKNYKYTLFLGIPGPF